MGVSEIKKTKQRKKAEEALRQSENLYRSLFENSFDGVVLTNPDGIVLAANPQACRMTGMSEEELKQIGRDKVIIWDERFLAAVRALECHGSAKAELTIKRKDGTTFEAEAASSLFVDSDGILKASVIVRDITERKKAEEAFRQSKQRMTDILMSIDDYVYALDRNWNFIYVSNKSANDWKYTAEALVGKNFWETFPRFLGTEVERNFRETMAEKEIRRFEWKTIYASGYREFTVFPSNEGITVYGKDITEQKVLQQKLQDNSAKIEKYSNRLEELVRERTKELEFSNKKLNEILESIDEGFFIIDRDWKIAYVNKIATEFWRVKPQDVIEQDFWKKFPKLKGSIVEEKLRTAMDQKVSEQFEVKGIYYDGYYEVKAHPSSEGISVLMSNITERKNMEKQLADNERLATIGATAGMVGHDLRNPLQSIAGEVYLAKEELKALPESEQKISLQESVDTIGEQAIYMDKIVSDLQAFVKPVEVHERAVDVKQLITAVLDQISIPQDIKTLIQIGENFVVSADPELLKRVVINLVTNAIQAMPNGGKLTLKTEINDAGELEIIVEDTGVGIPDKIKPKIFTPLFTTKAKGQGFGLAVCKRVMEAQGGGVTFESQEGKGSTFKIHLPYP